MIINRIEAGNDKGKFYNVDDVVSVIQQNINYVVNQDVEYYGKYSFKLSNEQYYVPDEDRKLEPNVLFMVVKFMTATLDFNQIILPFTLTVLSEKNNVDAAQKLLLEYSQTFNLTDGSGDYTDENNNPQHFMYKQTYDAPVVSSNFSEVYDGYRSIMTLTGNILINYSVMPLEYVKYLPNGENTIEEEKLKIKTLSNAFAYSNTLDSQPYSGKNRTESESRYGTLSLSFTTYCEANDLIRKCIKMALQKKDRNNNTVNNTSTNINVNTEFCFELKFTNWDDGTFIVTTKLQNADFGQPIGQFPTMTLSFTE
ncbi:MAG: hypothetical protein IKF82_01245 [Bacilli bacterium]|nr:hypothetical protein [Bacilli bacterium]